MRWLVKNHYRIGRYYLHMGTGYRPVGYNGCYCYSQPHYYHYLYGDRNYFRLHRPGNKKRERQCATYR
jgi:hypothetical protein